MAAFLAPACGQPWPRAEEASQGNEAVCLVKLLLAFWKLNPVQTSHGVFEIYYFKPINKL